MKAREKAEALDGIEERASENEFSDYGEDDKYRLKKRNTDRNYDQSPNSPAFFGDDYGDEYKISGKKRGKKSKKKGPGILDSSPHDLVGDEELGGRY